MPALSRRSSLACSSSFLRCMSTITEFRKSTWNFRRCHNVTCFKNGQKIFVQGHQKKTTKRS
jgi:hypothetical protein